ncbi:zinc protease [Ralstonia solanacearum]|nr:zinc protease [Ralstonia solanacearum]
MIDHGHRLPDILDYTLAQMRGFVAATVRSDATRDARLLSLIAIGTRGDARNLDQTLDHLTSQATGHARVRSNR